MLVVVPVYKEPTPNFFLLHGDFTVTQEEEKTKMICILIPNLLECSASGTQVRLGFRVLYCLKFKLQYLLVEVIFEAHILKLVKSIMEPLISRAKCSLVIDYLKLIRITIFSLIFV